MADETTTAPAATPGTGRITRIIGAVVDVEFPPDAIPEMYNALKVTIKGTGEGDEDHEITLEVAQHLGDNIVRTISLKPTDGLVRGSQVRDTGAPITVPVGDVTKGHVFNVTGEVLNLAPGERLEVTERWPIHRQPPAFDQLEAKEQMFETGIKVIDLLTPYVQGGKIGLWPRATAVSPSSPVWVSVPVRVTTSSSRWTRPASLTRPPSYSARWTSRRARVCVWRCPR